MPGRNVAASSSFRKPSPSPTFLQRHGVKFVASAIITAGIVFALKQGGLKFIPDSGNFDHIRWWTVPVYVASLAGMSYFRAVRWRYLLRSFAEIPTRKLLSVSWIGFAAILLMPLRIGEFVRPYMIRTPGRTDLEAAHDRRGDDGRGDGNDRRRARLSTASRREHRSRDRAAICPPPRAAPEGGRSGCQPISGPQRLGRWASRCWASSRSRSS